MWKTLVTILRDLGIPFEAGLTESEIQDAERSFHFGFPPDLRAFLQAGLPVGKGFPNWRSESTDSLHERMRAPLEGILFDVEHNGFWLPEWGARPGRLEDANAVVEKLVAAAPVLVPIYQHRMIPDRPHQPGNPVFSVHQTDIIYYGADLRDYLIHEFLTRADVGLWPIPDSVRKIEFWDIERFWKVRWSQGSAVFDNRKGILP